MKNDYLVIKLTDNWVKNEQIRVYMGAVLKRIGEGEILPAEPHTAILTKGISKGLLPKIPTKDINDITKKEFATALGMELIRRNAVDVSVDDEGFYYRITLTAHFLGRSSMP